MFSKSPAGLLRVIIIEGRNLKDKDIIGDNDPYVELWIDKQYKQATTVIENTNNPIWNQTFTFNLSSGSKHKLYMKILDKDPIGSDEIGEIKFDFEDAFSRPIDTWVKIPGFFGSSRGEIHIYVDFQRTQ